MGRFGIRDERGFTLYPQNRTMPIRTERRADYMIRQMGNPHNAEILEIGCGTGELSRILAEKTGSSVLGTDLSNVYIREARENNTLLNLRYETLDFNNPKALFSSRFDYILGNGILHHVVPRLDKALENLRTLLKDNGKIVFLEPNLYNPYCFLIFHTTGALRRWANLEPDEMALTKRRMLQKLKEHNFREIKIEYKDFLLPNTPYFMIYPFIFAGWILEKLFLINKMSQSIFISARK